MNQRKASTIGREQPLEGSNHWKEGTFYHRYQGINLMPSTPRSQPEAGMTSPCMDGVNHRESCLYRGVEGIPSLPSRPRKQPSAVDSKSSTRENVVSRTPTHALAWLPTHRDQGTNLQSPRERGGVSRTHTHALVVLPCHRLEGSNLLPSIPRREPEREPEKEVVSPTHTDAGGAPIRPSISGSQPSAVDSKASTHDLMTSPCRDGVNP